MKKLQKKLKVTLLSTAMAIALGSASIQMVQANSPDSVVLNASSMSYASGNNHIVLSVAGPEMDVVSTSSKSGSINWNLPANAKDGLYRYELSITTPSVSNTEADESDGNSAKAQRIHGSFVVANGQITTVESENDAPDVPHSDEHTSSNEPSLLKQVAISALDFLMPVAHADFITTAPDGDIVLEDDSPGLFFRRDPDTVNTSVLTQWVVKVDDTAGFALDDFIIYDDTMDRNVLILRDGTPFRQYFGANVYEVQNMDAGNASIIKIDKTNSVNTLVVGTGGNMRLLDNTVFIEKATARLGIGTTTPAESLDVLGKLRLSSVDGGYWNFGGADDFNFNFKDDAAGNVYRVMTVENTDNICDDGNPAAIAPCIGFFAADNPKASVHIKKDDGTTQLLVEEGSGTTAQRFMVEMKNNGGTGFLITDTSQAAASQWQFSTQPNEAFTASFIGTGGPEMQVRKDGAVQMGPGNVVNFALSANGHMTLLHGSATATAHITSSSRDVKQDFEKVDSKAILEKIKSLEITEWRYKDENEKGRHIGPMAEDFYKLFKLGADDKHVVGTDMASIALIAAKELQEEVSIAKAETITLKQESAELKASNTSLKKQLVEQQKRLASLEKLVTNLALSNGHLKSSGAKVALK